MSMKTDLRFFQGEGYMNIREKIPVEADTIFLLASITKTITGVAVMQLVEKGENRFRHGC